MTLTQNLHRLHNDQFELIVAPALGRIVRYGPISGPNVLWENPRAATTPSVFPGWINWGGDKIWIWPEADWAAWLGANVPPGDPAPTPHEVRSDGRSLTLTSPVITAYGIRIVRRITLAESGSQVTLVNRMEKVAEGTQSLPVGVWIVTQIPAASPVLARLTPDASSPAFASFANGLWQDVQVKGNIATLTRAANPWAKVGLDADVLTVAVGEHVFIAHTLGNANAPGPFEPCRRAQVFSEPDESPFRPADLPAYIEFEFTSPVKRLAIGESVSLVVNWELRRLRKGDASPPRAIIEGM